MPRAAQQESLAAQIRGLKNGQSASRTKRFSLADDNLTITEATRKLRNFVNQAVGRARNEIDGSDFRVETALGITSDHKALLCTVAVTRFDGEAANDDDLDEDDVDI